MRFLRVGLYRKGRGTLQVGTGLLYGQKAVHLPLEPGCGYLLCSFHVMHDTLILSVLLCSHCSCCGRASQSLLSVKMPCHVGSTSVTLVSTGHVQLYDD